MKWILALIMGLVLSSDVHLRVNQSAASETFAQEWSDLPDFAQYPTTTEKKQAFLSYLHPIVLQVNAKIKRERDKVISLHEKHQNGRRLWVMDRRWVENLAADHRIASFDMNNEAHWEQLIRKVDIVPAPLVLAQAATESGWGTSRLAKYANNLFGQTCTNHDCGSWAKGPLDSKALRMQRFKSVEHAVESYIRNLNSHPAYREARNIRAILRGKGEEVTGLHMVNGLRRYSERGHRYIRDIRAMIKQNRLEKFASLPHWA